MSDQSRKISSLRKRINEIDAELLRLLAERREVSLDVVRAKDVDESPIRDFQREEDLLVKRIRAGRELGLDAHYVTRIFHEIIDDSVRLQQEHVLRDANKQDAEPELIRVAFQGIEGAYSHLAAKKFFSKFGDRLRFLGLQSFEEVVKAVEEGRAEFAMLPIENTTSGGINEVYDLLLHTRLSIVGEEKYHVQHCLVAADDVPLASLREVYSHPQAVAQCSKFLATLAGCKVEYFTDTAMSVSKIKEDGDPTQAAIASEEAAKMFGLKVLRREIANQKENYTRFLVAARNPEVVPTRIPCKTSLVMATSQEPGSLVKSLVVFEKNGINLSKLESRPILGNPWEEMFYVDFEGNVAEDAVKRTLEELTRTTRFIKVLGSYRSQDLPRTTPSPRAISTEFPDAPAAGPAEDRSAPRPAAAESEPFRLTGRAHKPDDTVIEVRGVKIGGPEFVVIAGPCAVESREQIMACARRVKEHGAQVLRGGCFRPPSSPYSFSGLGHQGLDLLVEAGAAYGLPVVTEVVAPEDVAEVARKADILQIGQRNMQNFALLREVGRLHRPVLLKRGQMASIDEWLEAAQYVLEQGNHQVILCERGIRTLETSQRDTIDFNAIAALRRRTHLPVLLDPSHAAGDRDLVPPLALAARPVGAQGVMLEIHPDPERAVGDGRHALRFAQFDELMRALRR